MRNAVISGCIVAMLALMAADGAGQAVSPGQGQQAATITVRGRAEVFAPPDRVVISLAAVAQGERADGAQGQVNQILQRAIGSIVALGVPANGIQTTGITLSPVYSGEAPSPVRGTPGVVVQEPRIAGYRATNTLRVQLDNLRVLGQVIDAAVAAGANQLQDLSFQIRDDQPQRQEALRLAAADARNKAQAVAGALGLEIIGVRQVEEVGVELFRPQLEYRQMAAAQDAVAATPVQPGEVRVEAAVNVIYLVGGRSGEAAAPATRPSAPVQ